MVVPTESLSRAQRKVHGSSVPVVVPSLFLALSILITAYLILRGDGHAAEWPMDQGFVYVDLRIYNNGTNWIFQYPHLSYAGGITGSLLVGLYKLLIPTSITTLNWHVKISSATLFFISLFWLARTYKIDQIGQIAILTIVASSGLLLLEPSQEILAGAFLNLFAIAIRWHRQPMLQALFLSVFSLVKVELLPVGVIIAMFWTVGTKLPVATRLIFLAAFIVFVSAFMFPAVYLYGVDGLLSGRQNIAVSQHYCLVFHYDSNCLGQIMPDVRTMGDMIRNHTREYFVFLTATAVQSATNVFVALNLLALSPLLMIRPAFASVQREDQNLARLTLLVLMLTVITTLPFVFIHPRYLNRVLGLLVVAGFCGLRDAAGKRATSMSLGLTIIIVAANLLHFGDYLAKPHAH
jgi:hypothetical protein